MSDDSIRVELVAADRLVWSGDATRIIARTTEGDVGILPHHAPMLSLLVDGVVDIQTTDGETWVAAVDAGFLSVANNRVSVLSERAEMSHEIDLEQARHELQRAKDSGENDDEIRAEVSRLEARVRAAETAS
ncbi:F-type H+-transporting ATPase subunit epsilon [Nocardioides scoriae]|uniref:ATP synthase epsilon chain n=1 Tax=Nocardioides scoriae TaxID=642780 RepID=A0A1H1XZH9_9ACTN|nr:F0F1 ATP synthase subunit epsilon [Nocardioides scoriae]SDT14617.1 F-type H+-transporting ATPase subunit epsilon [Nocardioides scoriae]